MSYTVSFLFPMMPETSDELNMIWIFLTYLQQKSYFVSDFGLWLGPESDSVYFT